MAARGFFTAITPPLITTPWAIEFMISVGQTLFRCATSGSQVHGIYHANRSGHILNNLVYHNRAYGIHLWHAASDVVISGNTVFNNGSSGLVVGAGDEPKGNRADGCLVSNNIFAYNSRYALWNQEIPVPITSISRT